MVSINVAMQFEQMQRGGDRTTTDLFGLCGMFSVASAVRRRRRIHLHRGGDLLLDGHVSHRNRRRGAWLHAQRVGLPHADRFLLGSPHRLCQRCIWRQHHTEFLWIPNAVLCASWEFLLLCKLSAIIPRKRVDSRRGRAVACEPHRHLRARPDLLERCERRDDVVDALPAAGEPLQPVRGQEPLVCRSDVRGPDEGPAGVGRCPQRGAAGWRAARRRPAEHASATHLDDAHVVPFAAALAALAAATLALTAAALALASAALTLSAAALALAAALAAAAAAAKLPRRRLLSRDADHTDLGE